MIMDVLEPISIENLEKILKILSDRLPKALRGHHYIYNYLKNYEKLGYNYNQQISNSKSKPLFLGYRDGNPDNCTFIVITENTALWLFLYTSEESGTELLDGLRNTKLINWTSDEIQISIDYQYLNSIQSILNEKRSGWINCTPDGVYYLPRRQALSFDINTLPLNLQLRRLTHDDVELINDNWTHKSKHSLSRIEHIIKMNSGTGLISNNNQLVAWTITNEFFELGCLTTLKTEQRKGYASVVCKAESLRIAEENNVDIAVEIMRGNIASETLCKKLGFKKIGEACWIKIQKKDIY